MAYATKEDVETSLGRELDTNTEQPFLDKLLERAEALLLLRIPDLEERMKKDAYAVVVRGVESDAVARVFRSPNNGIYRREGEGNYSYELNMQTASGVLSIQPKEWDSLGVSTTFDVVSAVSDAYAETRMSRYRGSYSFQYDWPATDSLSKPI